MKKYKMVFCNRNIQPISIDGSAEMPQNHKKVYIYF